MTVRQSRFIAVGVLAVGLCTSLVFFRRPSPHVGPLTRHAAEEPPQRRPQELTLQVSSPPGTTQAEQIIPPDERLTAAPAASLPPLAHPTPEGTPPPVLAPEYESLLLPSERLSTSNQAANEEEARTEPLAKRDASSVPARQQVICHRVADGDTLERLAAKYLGSRERALEIFRANQDVLEHREILPIGVELKIPASAAATVPQEDSSTDGEDWPQEPMSADTEDWPQEPTSVDTEDLVPLRKHELLRLKARSL